MVWIVFVVCVLLIPIGYAGYRMLRRQPTGPEPPTLPEEPWDPQAEVRKLIDASKDIRALYGGLGYLPQMEWKFERVLREMEGLVRTEIPDFTAFRANLEALQTQFEQPGRSASDPVAQAWLQRGEGDLLSEVIAAGDDRERVLDLLNRDPVNAPLPFIEQLPFLRDGRLVWRTPVGLSVLRKRPVNPTRFAHLLYAIESQVRTAQVRRNARGAGDVLETIGRLRKDLDREDAYFPTGLKALEKDLTDWLHNSRGRKAREQRATLDHILLELVTLRHEYGTERARGEGLDAQEAAAFREAVQTQVKLYLDSAWLHTPGLTAYFLATLIDSEQAGLAGKERASALGVLRVVREEIASGQYDSQETMRRLRDLEGKDVYVHSLVYALLRLSGTEASRRQGSAGPEI